MDFDMEFARNQQTERVSTTHGTLTSRCFHCGGAYTFGTMLPGYFIPFASHSMNSAVIEYHRRETGGFAVDGDPLCGESDSLRAGIASELGGNRPVASNFHSNGQNEHHFVPPAGTTMDAHVGFDFAFASQDEITPSNNVHVEQNWQNVNIGLGSLQNGYCTPTQLQTALLQYLPDHQVRYSENGDTEPLGDQAAPPSPSEADTFVHAPQQLDARYGASTSFPFPGDFSPASPSNENSTKGNEMSNQEISFSNSFERNSNTSSASTQLYAPSNQFSQDNSYDMFGIESNTSTSLGSSPANQEYNISYSSPYRTLPSAQLASQQSSFSISSSTNPTTIPNIPSPHSSGTPSPPSSSTDSHICGVCNKVFKRISDLKRHEKVHYPNEKSFHCRQPGCKRNGRKGFYRRDKLLAHGRQVHGVTL